MMLSNALFQVRVIFILFFSISITNLIAQGDHKAEISCPIGKIYQGKDNTIKVDTENCSPNVVLLVIASKGTITRKQNGYLLKIPESVKPLNEVEIYVFEKINGGNALIGRQKFSIVSKNEPYASVWGINNGSISVSKIDTPGRVIVKNIETNQEYTVLGFTFFYQPRRGFPSSIEVVGDKLPLHFYPPCGDMISVYNIRYSFGKEIFVLLDRVNVFFGS